jgi:SpoVK/Ycf46/Vps4 family AAA+-type ATPase
MIGMHKLKCNVVEQLLYFMQGFHETRASSSAKGITSPTSSGGGSGDFTKGITSPTSSGGGSSDFTKGITSPTSSGGGDFKHTVIYGPPGTGKTEVAKLIGQMYSKIGVLSKKNIFKKVTRNDLVAGYLGQTAIKTKAVITECLGGVLFIDEVYALGNENDLDSFSRECIDTLCEALSDHKDNLMVIVAGYEKEIERHFFSANPGLDSRFVWRFAIEKYTPTELRDIFVKKVGSTGWIMEKETANPEWFSKHKDVFTHYGRDMERLFLYVKIAHSKRVFGKSKEIQRIITEKDMTVGLDTFLENRKKDDSGKLKREILTSMYV